jgi:hypothetical protein
MGVTHGASTYLMRGVQMRDGDDFLGKRQGPYNKRPPLDMRKLESPSTWEHPTVQEAPPPAPGAFHKASIVYYSSCSHKFIVVCTYNNVALMLEPDVYHAALIALRDALQIHSFYKLSITYDVSGGLCLS